MMTFTGDEFARTLSRFGGDSPSRDLASLLCAGHCNCRERLVLYSKTQARSLQFSRNIRGKEWSEWESKAGQIAASLHHDPAAGKAVKLDRTIRNGTRPVFRFPAAGPGTGKPGAEPVMSMGTYPRFAARNTLDE